MARPEGEPGVDVPPEDDRARARQVYRAALDEGQRLTGEELAERFGRSKRWGRDRIRERRTA
ncbi:hypothetical protein [Nocardiopsis sp. ATB16-24]|uniref:hypothetical protein n=1 Tax=Nocardiopsis sp. ATB16-24 TaxID=3019555 RepID=UPI002554177D|nr:hypothetical protein [Nocardiopsis sp. ATB16-24]